MQIQLSLWLRGFPLIAVLSLIACQTPDGPIDASEAEDYEVASVTPFYRLGPQQPSGPDLSLEEGRRVKMLKRSFGFSQVMLDNGWDGWVATEEIRPAPELPPFPEADALRSSLVGLDNNPAIVSRSRSASSTGQREVTPDLPSPENFDDSDFAPVDLAVDPAPTEEESTTTEFVPDFRY